VPDKTGTKVQNHIRYVFPQVYEGHPR
jgi:hypothetical protein